MYIILSQKKDFKSEYKDELFKLYHFPASYRGRINTGDIFVYNQGSQGGPKSSKIRYYFGTGIIGKIYSEDEGKTYFAELRNCKMFYNDVSITLNDGSYIEQLEYEDKRSKPNWQSSIRTLSESAYKTIINMSGGLIDVSANRNIESIKADLKVHIDNYYLNDNHQSLVDIISLAMNLINQYGISVN